MSAHIDGNTTVIAPPRGQGVEPPSPYSSLVRVDLAGLSHPGKLRPNNEDHFLITRFGRFLEVAQTNLPPDMVPPRSDEIGYAMVVADGMGGQAAGEEASRRAIASLVNLVLRTPDWIMRLDEGDTSDAVMRRASERYEQINRALAEEARGNPMLRGFGTTMTGAWSVGREVFVAHLGDSRAYLLSGGQLRQLTRDHTLAQDLVDRRVLDPEDAPTHRLRHVLTQSLGDHGREVQPDVTRVTLQDNDCLMLCTDGLTEMVGDRDIGAILASDAPAEALCQRLVDRALEAGGKDNVTVVVARYRLP